MSIRTRDAIRADIVKLGQEVEADQISMSEFDDRKMSLLEEALDAPDAAPEQAPSEPSYTVVGTYSAGLPFVTTVFTHNGPEAALDLAHAAFAAREKAEPTEEMQIAAIFAGEPKLIDFDKPETWIS